MFNILLTVFNTTHLMKNKRRKVKLIYVKSTNLAETFTEAEENIDINVHNGMNNVTHLIRL